MNEEVLAMICLKNILDSQYPLFWQKTLSETKNKNKNNESRLRADLEDEIKKMSKDEKNLKNHLKH